MHEFSTMASVVAAVREEGRKHRADRICRVGLEVGALTFLNPEQLHFAFGILTRDTEVEGATLDIATVPPEVRCPCGYAGDARYEERQDFHLRIPTLRCPRCGQPVEIVRGRECRITEVEIEVEYVSSA
ncbi:MAG: hydrogenase maturation nickel metallochaperone HypA [Candidatus Thermoplasmatota archaeon]|nr:hydrogenase maturation nickel metallochaperone HypA [Candidatus Thermoplasmatota archaeon]